MIGVDLFSGAGGMSLGAIHAGIQVNLAVDHDKHTLHTYHHNHNNVAICCEDIRNFDSCIIRRRIPPEKELVVFGGPPCQGFSYSNLRTRTTANPDNWLFIHFLRIVCDVTPDWIVLENVRGIVNTAKGIFLKEIVSRIEDLGYTVSFSVLNALDYGVPQDRARFFLVGSRNGVTFTMPDRTRQKPLTVHDAITDLPDLQNGASENWLPYKEPARSQYAGSLRTRLRICPNHLVTRNSDRVVQRYGHIPPGGNWEDIPAYLMNNYKDRSRCHTGIYRRLHYESPSTVIGNFRKNMLVHPRQDRGLSVREAARIQSFPDWYEFKDSIGFQQQQVGNAVPPLLAKAVFVRLLRH